MLAMTNTDKLQLPELTIRQAKFLEHYLKHGNATEAYKQAGYKTKYADRACFILINNEPMKSHLEYYRNESKKITFEMKADLLWRIAQESIAPIHDDNGKVVKWGDKDVAIKAIAELNKMVGDYAPEKSQTVNVQADWEDVRNARLEYKKDK
jgi:hypothetical protein